MWGYVWVLFLCDTVGYIFLYTRLGTSYENRVQSTLKYKVSVKKKGFKERSLNLSHIALVSHTISVANIVF